MAQAEVDQIIARRQEIGRDQYDEVWEGVYVMAPMANDEHQRFVSRLAYILEDVVGIPAEAEVRAGVNVSDREESWEENFRVPDVAVFLKGTSAGNCDTFWLGGPDFLIEITNPYDQTHGKLPFYSSVGVREALVVNRRPWQLELYRQADGELAQVRVATVQNKLEVAAEVVPLTFALQLGDDRPQMVVQHVVGGAEQQTWIV